MNPEEVSNRILNHASDTINTGKSTRGDEAEFDVHFSYKADTKEFGILIWRIREPYQRNGIAQRAFDGIKEAMNHQGTIKFCGLMRNLESIDYQSLVGFLEKNGYAVSDTEMCSPTLNI
ncbi:MAG: hypothetical protein ACSHX4_09840 [Opitutaceae bacterium]